MSGLIEILAKNHCEFSRHNLQLDWSQGETEVEKRICLTNGVIYNACPYFY